MVIKSLSKLEPLEKGRVVKVGGRGRIRQRLLDMGIVPAAVVEIKRVAPLGDPVLIRVKGYDLALRREEAENIQVELTVMPLSMALPGEVVEVVAVRAGWGLQRRLTDLGLTPGVSVSVVSSGRPGPIELDVRGSRLALGHGVAHKIMVSTIGKQEND